MNILLDKTGYTQKPSGKEIGKISTRIVNNIYESKNIREIADLIGNHGHTWCPAIFNGKRNKNNFKEIQLIALDFDGGISFEEVCQISETYMIPILFAYETFSSVNKNKFRIVFQLENPIVDMLTFDIIIDMLMTIFKGCDTACKDVSRIFFGGKNLFYFNDKEPHIHIKTLIMNFHKYFKDKYGATHYKAYIRKFANKYHLALNKKNIFHLGKNSPDIYSDINTNGEKLRNHKAYRSDTLDKLKEKCQLFCDFTEDFQWLYYNQLFGIALNLIHVEKGNKLFLDTIDNSQFDTYKKDWKFYLRYFKDSEYLPMNCNSFCPYADTCPHGSNMLCTAKIKRKEIIRVSKKEYVSVDEVYSDLKHNFENAILSDDKDIHVIKAQTTIGKTHMYIDYLKNTSVPTVIALPTNILKNEVYLKCIESGIDVRKTPSIEEIKDEIPENVYNTIQHMYSTGQHKQIHKFIANTLKNQDIPALKGFMDDKKALKDFNWHIITTHHRVLYADKAWLNRYQIIFDEDILKTIINNQETVLISDIEELFEKNLPKEVKHKFVDIIEKSENNKFFTSDKVKLKHDIPTEFDLSALMKAKKFYSDGESVMFYKTPKLKKHKYIVLSATANQFIYEKYFGIDRVHFYTCRQAEYKGHLYQYYNHSYSRNYISKNAETYADIQEITGNIPTITFKKFSDECEIHFGNSEGCNFMQGQDIAVVGTPHMSECVYKLMAYQMKGDVSDTLHYREVEYNGFKFWFHTYGDELLRQIQFWLIESELEQSVGRARLLRNDCTAHLFSDFPLRQSEFKETLVM